MTIIIHRDHSWGCLITRLLKQVKLSPCLYGGTRFGDLNNMFSEINFEIYLSLFQSHTVDKIRILPLISTKTGKLAGSFQMR